MKKEKSFKTRVLKFLGVHDDEEDDRISEEEAQRRYQIAMEGWRKVRKMRFIIRAGGVGLLQGKRFEPPKEKFWTFDHFVLLPTSLVRRMWEMMFGFIIVYQLIIVPYRECWQDFREGFLIVDYVFDVICTLNIILNFFFAHSKRTKVYRDFKHIAEHYLLGNFVIDVLAVLPYYWMSATISQFYWFRFFRFVQVGQALRTLEEFWKTILLKATSNINFIKSLTRIINFLTLMMIIGQLLASIWFSLGSQTQIDEGVYYTTDSTGATVANEYYLNGWVEAILPSSTYQDRTTQYITSLYWTFTTLSTVGYGDIHGSLTSEYLYNMAVEFIGVFLFAYMMGNINNLIEKLDNDHAEFIEEESDLLDQWLMKIDRANPTRKLEHKMTVKIRDFFRTYWQKDHTMIQQEYPFLNQLPLEVRSKLIGHLFAKFIKQFSVFFKGCEEAFNHEIVINLVPRKFTKGTEIIKVDQGSKDIYFITKGSVIIGSHQGIEKYLELGTGSFFGDHLILFNLRSSNSFIAKDEEVECMCLNKKKFLELCEMFPATTKVLKYKAYLRRKEFRRAKLETIEAAERRAQLKNQSSLNQSGKFGLDGTPKDIDLPGNAGEKEKKDAEKEEKSAEKEIYTADKHLADLEKLLNEEGSKIEELTKKAQNLQVEQLAEPSKEDQAQFNSLLDHAKTIKLQLDKAESKLNQIESDFTKKMKNIKYLIDFISNFEELFVANQNKGDK